MFGKHSLYIFLSYGAAAVVFVGLIGRAKWALWQAKQCCKTAVNEQQNASNS
jgi:heme exporter protein CcmD